MRTINNLIPAFILTVGVATHAQQSVTPPSSFENRLRQFTDDADPQPEQALKHFDLEFEGGTPRMFIDAVNAQAGIKVNVIIPPEHAMEPMPPIDVRDITLPQLFEAGIAASRVETNIIAGSVTITSPRAQTPNYNYTRAVTSKGFRTTDRNPSERSIWYFFVERPPAPVMETLSPRFVEVFQLGYLLESYSVDDITTAIQIAWDLQDDDVDPVMKFHEETKLLVAGGSQNQLAMISTVIQQLGIGMQQARSRQPSPNPTVSSPASIQRTP